MSTTYRDAPLLKPPVWTWEVPLYFFVGGAAGVAAIIAAAAHFAGPSTGTLARDAKWLAAVGALISPLLLISDLGRPARFLFMLRVFKPQSPMSMGVWTLVAFSAAAFAALLPMGALAGVATAAAAVLGALLATYTGVLIGATAIPVWARNVDILPAHFGASGLGAAVSILELLGHRTAAMNTLGVIAAVAETILIVILLARGSSAGRLMHAAEILSGPLPLVLRLSAAHVPAARLVIAGMTIAGSLLTRVAWIDAGRHSALQKR